MYTGIVETGSLNGFKFVLFAFEVVSNSGAVSPMILATPNEINALLGAGLILFIMTLFVNLAANYIVKRSQRERLV